MLNKCLLLLSIISHTPFIFFYIWTLYKIFLTHLGWPSFSLLILGLSLYMLLPLSKKHFGPSLASCYRSQLRWHFPPNAFPNPQACTKRLLLNFQMTRHTPTLITLLFFLLSLYCFLTLRTVPGTWEVRKYLLNEGRFTRYLKSFAGFTYFYKLVL